MTSRAASRTEPPQPATDRIPAALGAPGRLDRFAALAGELAGTATLVVGLDGTVLATATSADGATVSPDAALDAIRTVLSDIRSTRPRRSNTLPSLERSLVALDLVVADRGAGSAAAQLLRHPSTDDVIGALVLYSAGIHAISDTAAVRASDVAAAIESELARSAAHAHVALDALDQGVVLIGRDGSVLQENAAALRLIGGRMTEFFTRDGDWAICDADGVAYPPGENPVFLSLVSGESLRGAVLSWHRHDGVWLVASVTVEHDDSTGNTVISFVDMTTEVRNKKRYNSVLDTVQVGFVVFDRAGRVHQANPAFLSQLGADHDAVVGSELGACFADPGVRAQLSYNTIAVLGDEWSGPTCATVSLEGQLARPDGDEVWVAADMSVLDLPAGLSVITTHDVTERRRFIRRLSRYEQLFQHSNDLIYIFDRQLRVRYSSPSNTKILGYEPDEPFDTDMIHPEDQERAAMLFRRLIDGEADGEPFVLQVRAKNGEFRSLDCVGTNLLDEPSVAGVVLTCRDATERERLTAQLRHRAGHDELTDLPNRKTFETRVTKALTRSNRAGSSLAVAYIDLDGFKSINDSLGHSIGDRVLIEVARRLKRVVRRGDLAARVGGDEFVVLLDPANDTDVEPIAVRLRDAITEPVDEIGPDLEWGASVGVALSAPGDTTASLLRRADSAMYRAKRRRRSAIEIAAAPDTGTTRT